MTLEQVTIDIPGAFDSYLSGSSLAAGEATGYEGAPALYAAYRARELVRRGRGHTVRLSIPATEAPAALECLAEYAEMCVVANSDLIGDPTVDPDDRQAARTETRAAHSVRERVSAVLELVGAS